MHPIEAQQFSSYLLLIHITVNHAYRAAVGRGCHGRIRAQRLGDRSVAAHWSPGVLAQFLGGSAALQHVLVHIQGELALVDVDGDGVAIFDEPDKALVGRLGGDVADGKAGGAAGKAAVGNQGACLAQPGALEERGWVEHLLHARAAGRAFIANDHHVARLNLLVQDYRYGLFLGFDHTSRSREGPQLFIDARCFHDGTVWSQVSAQDNQAAVGRKGMIGVVNAAISGVSIELVPAVGLGKWFGGAHAAGAAR